MTISFQPQTSLVNQPALTQTHQFANTTPAFGGLKNASSSRDTVMIRFGADNVNKPDETNAVGEVAASDNNTPLAEAAKPETADEQLKKYNARRQTKNWLMIGGGVAAVAGAAIALFIANPIVGAAVGGLGVIAFIVGAALKKLPKPSEADGSNETRNKETSVKTVVNDDANLQLTDENKNKLNQLISLYKEIPNKKNFNEFLGAFHKTMNQLPNKSELEINQQKLFLNTLYTDMNDVSILANITDAELEKINKEIFKRYTDLKVESSQIPSLKKSGEPTSLPVVKNGYQQPYDWDALFVTHKINSQLLADFIVNRLNTTKLKSEGRFKKDLYWISSPNMISKLPELLKKNNKFRFFDINLPISWEIKKLEENNRFIVVVPKSHKEKLQTQQPSENNLSKMPVEAFPVKAKQDPQEVLKDINLDENSIALMVTLPQEFFGCTIEDNLYKRSAVKELKKSIAAIAIREPGQWPSDSTVQLQLAELLCYQLMNLRGHTVIRTESNDKSVILTGGLPDSAEEISKPTA